MDPATLLRSCRRRAGLSQRALAARAGTSAAAVCLYERGERVPRVDTLARLLAAAGATLQLGGGPAPDLDLGRNGRALRQVLDLADRLPRRRSARLEFPALRELAR